MKTRIVGVSVIVVIMLVLLFVLWCFSDAALADEGGTNEHTFNLPLFSFVRPLGISALTLVLITFSTGLFRRKLGRRFVKVHRTLAWLAAGLAVCHGALVLALF